MKFIDTITLTATLAVAVKAAPLNQTEMIQHLYPRSFQGSINWFERWDCTNPCVETGYCLSGQVGDGMEGSADPWIGWDSGCWDRPAGAHSIALSVDNGHKFRAIDKTCEEFAKDGGVAKAHTLKVEDGYGDGKCNTLPHHHVKAVYYVW